MAKVDRPAGNRNKPKEKNIGKFRDKQGLRGGYRKENRRNNESLQTKR